MPPKSRNNRTTTNAFPLVEEKKKKVEGEWESPLLQGRWGALQALSVSSGRGTAGFNSAMGYALDMVKSESARVDGKLMEDISVIMKGNCVYMENFVCDAKDFSLFNEMKQELISHSGEELDKDGLIPWSKHQIYENPDGVSKVFGRIIDMCAEYFDVEVYATRLNYYRDGSQWKPYHHDSHAYGGKALREDFTMGISLGTTRALSFLHEPTKLNFEFPQKNGDMFAFTSDVNNRFMHGVPKTRVEGDRFSIIAWGRRRTINERNGGAVEVSSAVTNNVNNMDDAIAAAHELVSGAGAGRADYQRRVKEQEEVMMQRRQTSTASNPTAGTDETDEGSTVGGEGAAEVTKPKKKKTKNRLQ